MPRPTIKRVTVTIDAAGKSVGRLATEIVRILQGKHKATWAPNVDAGDIVQVANADKMKFTGAKLSQKEYFHYSGYPGGMRARKAGDVMAKNPMKVLRYAVDRMLPKNTFRARRIKRLTVAK